MDRIERFDKMFEGLEYSRLLESDSMELMEDYMVLVKGLKALHERLHIVDLGTLLWLVEGRCDSDNYLSSIDLEKYEKMVDEVCAGGL